MVSIDAVYQKVLTFANKEQRGYITPQQFNLFADQAQKEIFEQYFYDIDQFERRVEGDIDKLIKSKIELFKVITTSTAHYASLPSDAYFIDSVYLNMANGKQVPVEKMDRDDSYNIWAATNHLPLLKSKESRPTYAIVGSKILFRPNAGNYKINYIKEPSAPKWSYVVVNERAMYDSSNKTDFQLHAAEENELVYKILKFAGLSMKRDDLARGGQGLESLQVQQQKQ